jgi:hypothetical protein
MEEMMKEEMMVMKVMKVMMMKMMMMKEGLEVHQYHSKKFFLPFYSSILQKIYYYPILPVQMKHLSDPKPNNPL